MKNPTARQQLVSAAFRIITAMQETVPQTIRVIVCDRRTGVRAVVDANTMELFNGTFERLSPVQRAILEVLTHEPQPMKKVASLAGL